MDDTENLILDINDKITPSTEIFQEQNDWLLYINMHIPFTDGKWKPSYDFKLKDVNIHHIYKKWEYETIQILKRLHNEEMERIDRIKLLLEIAKYSRWYKESIIEWSEIKKIKITKQTWCEVTSDVWIVINDAWFRYNYLNEKIEEICKRFSL